MKRLRPKAGKAMAQTRRTFGTLTVGLVPVLLLAVVRVSARAQDIATSPTTPLSAPWQAYKARRESIMTATIYTTDTVRMLRTPRDPMEAPRAIVIEGKIDRLHQRSKANIYLDFPSFRFGSQLKKTDETTYTLERSMLVLNDEWIPFERNVPAKTGENPEVLLLDLILLPNADQGWKAVSEPEEHAVAVDGTTVWLPFVTYHSRDERIAVSLSTDGQALRTIRGFDAQGHLRSSGEVVSFARKGPFGLIASEIAFRQYDDKGQPYRELNKVTHIRLNDPRFTYLFE